MTLPADFVAELKCPPFTDILAELQRKDRSPQSTFCALGNEVAPSDLYCYFRARFGLPNGPQNFLRNDSSDNLIHWEWMLRISTGWVLFQGMNFRTAVVFLDVPGINQADMANLAAHIKADFASHGQQMAQLRRSLEDWTEFVNPYQRIRSSVDSLLRELDALKLRPEDEEIPDITSVQQVCDADWSEVSARYSKGLGLCFGIRSMLPVMAEAFVNLLLFALMRPEIKSDERLRDNAIRQPIDVRIKSLSMTCVGFESPVDYKHAAFKAYHTLVNERNDLLHGNVVLEKLKFNEVFFNGRVPVFKCYRSLWERTVGVDIQAVGLHRLANEVQVVDSMVDQLKSHMTPTTRKFIEQVSEQRDLALDEGRGKFGVLFSRRLVNMFTPDDGEADLNTAV
ncbi:MULTISPECIES: hypothetical protein [Rhodanobacter]|uniref:hypothetical protein n=1 Tax=Rhodanobacter TaxID=75309 RepID=UPI00055AB358|nr:MULTISPECIES: hypothetical protein [Rhodanobacter]KZC21287.1 hypothetical protein RHOFW104R3_21500 [Rhodanobacter denitrificans]UJJ59081.1 hypothetical protein LRK55_02775 [Rhodanobacter denitrificans]UJM94884.1 hypothetical protein LRK32_05465 [Rhodanobacter denitrificans]UJM98414.1 hypothetical protein LRK44_05470 [Rhodanobacter denitrificans]UJN22173.1 hypothetical protein LRK54_03025 [Rhodanobacter denitrificans]